MEHKKEFFKPLNGHVIIHSKGEMKAGQIFVPNTGSYRDHRQWVDRDNTVYAVAENVKLVKVGDKVLIDIHAKLGGMNKLTEIMEKKLGVKFTIDIKDKTGKNLLKQETEKYFVVKEENIVCVIK